MQIKPATLDSQLGAIDGALGTLPASETHRTAVERLRSDLAAARFHLKRASSAPPLLAILGGTGTGKSTLLNRLLETEVAAASFRRTFTAGPIAVSSSEANIPPKWLGIEHVKLNADKLPVRGEPD